uniref:Uncharacterized protein n=1 Tax=Cuerna arida TaxID=1464854 RepID=A0A1B6F7K9_9HEMI
MGQTTFTTWRTSGMTNPQRRDHQRHCKRTAWPTSMTVGGPSGMATTITPPTMEGTVEAALEATADDDPITIPTSEASLDFTVGDIQANPADQKRHGCPYGLSWFYISQSSFVSKHCIFTGYRKNLRMFLVLTFL